MNEGDICEYMSRMERKERKGSKRDEKERRGDLEPTERGNSDERKEKSAIWSKYSSRKVSSMSFL